MADQLRYNDDRLTLDVNVTMPRSDDRHLVVRHVLGPLAAVKECRLVIKTKDGNDTTVMALAYDTDPDYFDFSVDNEVTIRVPSSLSTGVDLDTYKYAVEFVDQNDVVYTPQRGDWTLSDDVATNTGTAPYLSWTTRTDIDTDITALEAELSDWATSFDATYLTVALAGGEGSLTVVDASAFTAADDIRVVLDSGYEDEVIDSITNNVITLVGTVSAAAAAGKIVRKLP